MDTPAVHPNFLTLAQVAEMIPAVHGKTHANTIASWITKGRDGVYLQAWKPGRCYFTTLEAVQEFLDAIEARRTRRINAVASHTRVSRARIAAANKKLASHGI